jgi:hypothetical protein
MERAQNLSRVPAMTSLPATAASDVFRGLSVGLQLVGIVLLLLGIAVVRSWLDRTADAAAGASHALRSSLRRRLALRVENALHWYATRRGEPFHMARTAGDTISISDSATVSVSRGPATPEGLSDQERLSRVETRVLGVQLQVDRLEQARVDDQGKLDQQQDQLRAEIREATREGWQFITAGLALTFVGIVLGLFA